MESSNNLFNLPQGNKSESSVQVISEMISFLKIAPTNTGTNPVSGLIIPDGIDMTGPAFRCIREKPKEKVKTQRSVTCPKCENHPLMLALIKIYKNFPFTSDNYSRDEAMKYQKQTIGKLSKIMDKHGCLSCNCFLRLNQIHSMLEDD